MSISRRDAMLGATAAAVVTGATVVPLAIKAAGVKAALAGDPLVALEAELMEARAASLKATAVWGEAYSKAGDWAFGWPHVEYSNPAMEKMRGWIERDPNSWYNRMGVVPPTAIEEFNRHTELSASDDLLTTVQEEGRERVRWFNETSCAQKAAQEAVGIDDLGGRCENAHKRERAIEGQIFRTPAESMHGVLIKLREIHYQLLEESKGAFADETAQLEQVGDVLRDLEHLAGEARS